MKILVDADSCPKPTRDAILRAIQRTSISGIFVANRPIPGITEDHLCTMEVCGNHSGAADDRIVELAEPGDLAITRDIPLASRLVEAQVSVIDDRIVELAEPGDLAITRDIPLASRLVEAQVSVIDDRGRLYSKENIRERLSLRDFMVGLAEHGLGPERIASYGKRELKAFADGFDRELQRLIRLAQGTGPGSA